MSGAEVFAMDPDEVHEAVEKLFEIETEAQIAADGLNDETDTAATTLAEKNLSLGPALKNANRWWHLDRAKGFTLRVGNLGEYLAVCAEEAVEIDAFNAADFAQYADLDRYPDRDSRIRSMGPN